MDTTKTAPGPQSRGRFLNVALAANAALLGVLVVGQSGSVSPSAGVGSTALAAPPAPGPDENDASARISAADQRKQMIGELQSISSRLTAIESTLRKGISVKVTEMPESKADKGDRK